MAEVKILTLDLRNPLRYRRDGEIRPFEYNPARGEALFLFALVPPQDRSFDPRREALLGPPVAGGLAAEDAGEGKTPYDALFLPAGVYLFAQVRELLTQEAFITLAVDLQREALRQGLNPDSRIYLRYVIEEGGPVTQGFRPLIPEGEAKTGNETEPEPEPRGS